MTRYCLATWFTLTCAAIAFAQTPPATDAAALPQLNYVHKRINELEKQIADRIARLRDADEYTTRALQAEINYRITARQLLRLGAQAKDNGAVAMLYGHTLTNHADDVATMVNRMPQMVKLARDPKEKLTEEQKLAVSRFAAAVADFNNVVADPANELDSADAARVDRYLQKTMGPLVAMAAVMGEPEPVNTWPRRIKADETVIAPPVLTAADLDDLTQRIHAAKISSETKTELVLMVDLLRRGLSEPDLRPRVAGFYDLLDQALVVAEAFSGVTWANAKTTTDFREQLHTAILLVKDPRTRQSGVARFESLSESLDVLNQIGQLEAQAAPIEPLRDLFLISHTLRIEQRDLQTARYLLDYLQRMMGVMLSYRDLLADELPLDLRKVSLAVRSDYQQRELKMLSDLRELAANPSQVDQPEWTDPLNELAEAQALVRRVHMIPRWNAQLQRFKPRPTNGLFRELRDMALRLLDAKTRNEGATALRVFEQQIMMFDPMPLEQAVRTDDSPISRITRGANLLIADQMDRLRGDWASAWASKQDPRPAAQRLISLRRLLIAADMAQHINNLDDAVAKLNRWAGWEVEPGAITPLMNVMPDRIAQACRDAAIGNWDSLDMALEQIDRESALPLMVARLHGELNPALDTLPTGLVGLLSQCVYAPTDDSIAADQRDDLAKICLALMEAAHARRSNDSRQLAEALSYVGTKARAVLAARSGDQ
ncbi:hypothetical protein HED60_12875 [Planctomycetales bacterium ZRK34]|nr:hypothetical protein HED60_12875 [Planctomycetales bacterium ZRK34]